MKKDCLARMNYEDITIEIKKDPNFPFTRLLIDFVVEKSGDQSIDKRVTDLRLKILLSVANLNGVKEIHCLEKYQVVLVIEDSCDLSNLVSETTNILKKECTKRNGKK